jgi:hypothetical protein
MTYNELIADVCARNLELLKWTLADFSEADMLVRPCAGANHGLWQLGHLINSEVFMVNACRPGAGAELPAGFGDRYSPKTAGVDDPKALGTKAELLELLGKVRAATIRWIGSLNEAEMSRPGPEMMREFAPTVGHIAMLMPDHLLMHLGQLQVIRRKLGKPILF